MPPLYLYYRMPGGLQQTVHDRLTDPRCLKTLRVYFSYIQVIAFPKNQNAQCLVSEAPALVDKAQLDELGLEVE